MVREVLKYPDPLLKKVSEDVKEVNDEIKELGQDLIDTMLVQNGLGLSAPQIGILKRIIVVMATKSSSQRPVPVILINPKVIKLEGRIKDAEGCLSFPGVFEKVDRAKTVEVWYTDIFGDEKHVLFDGLEARAVLHEIDHLDGKLFIEKMSPIRRSLIDKKVKKLVQ